MARAEARVGTYGFLGALRVEVSGREVAVGGPKPRAILLRLLIQPGVLVSVDSLIDSVWEDRAPLDAAKNVQIYVARMRKVLPPGELVSGPGGYRIDCDRDQLDALAYEWRVSEARRLLEDGQLHSAVDLYTSADTLWRGDVLADARYASFSQTAIAYYEQLRETVREECFDARLDLGQGPSLVPDLDRFVINEPLRERRWAQLMKAYYQAGRQSDALRTYERLRTTFAEEMGLDPSPELRELELRILDHDPSLMPSSQSTLRITRSDERGSDLVAIVAECLSPDGDIERTIDQVALHDAVSAARAIVEAIPTTRVVLVPSARVALGDRLLPLGRPGEIVVAQDLHAALADHQDAPAYFLPAGWIEDGRGYAAAYLLTGGSAVAVPPTARGNLPAYRNVFLGRDRELDLLASHLDEAQSATITGPGGMGKTRLAVEYATQRAEGFPDGTWIVDLSGVAHIEALRGVLQDMLGLAVTDDLATIARSISARRMLVVFDNCEHLAGTVGSLVDTIATVDSVATIITTSRIRLGRPGERVVRLEPLPWVDDASAPAVRLVEARASELGIPVAKSPLLGSLCAAVAGIPLAIELAVAQLEHLSVPELLARMDHQVDVLTVGAQRGRHGSIRAVFESGLSLLSPSAHALLLDASVFRGVFDLHDLAALTDGTIPTDDVRELTAFSMLGAASDQASVTRYRMLEPLRQFAYAGLLGSNRVAVIHCRHAEYFLTVADDLVAGRRPAGVLEDAIANLGAALEWARRAGHDDLSMRLAAMLLSLPATVRTSPRSELLPSQEGTQLWTA